MTMKESEWLLFNKKIIGLGLDEVIKLEEIFPNDKVILIRGTI